MAFTVAGLNASLILDNPKFERVFRSDLHDLVVLLRRGGFTVSQAAAEMKKIPHAKWAKYAQTRRYLTNEIAMLTDFLRAVPSKFATRVMNSQTADTILHHEFRWESDTGTLADLAGVRTREHVTWGQWPAALTACIGLPHGQEYLHPGHHFGLGGALANTGSGSDNHTVLGPFNQTILNYNGVAQRAAMDQVYEYSYNAINWYPIEGSSYTIVREVSLGPRNAVQIALTKTNTAKPRDTFTVRKTL